MDGGIRTLTDLIVRFAALQRICSPEGPPPRAATVRRWADKQGIRYKFDRHAASGPPWTWSTPRSGLARHHSSLRTRRN